MKKPILTVFIDGLKPESLEHMPFLNSFIYKKRLKPVLGHSITCHASMYTGVYPNKHLKWFLWKYSPTTSPYKWINSKNLKLIDKLYAEYLIPKLTSFFKKCPIYTGRSDLKTKLLKGLSHTDILGSLISRITFYLNHNTSFSGIPILRNTPFRYWPYFDVVDTKMWNEYGYLDTYPTIFDILSDNKIEYDVFRVKGKRSIGLEPSKGYNSSQIKPWTYLFIGDIDGFSHRYGYDSSATIAKLREIDQILEKKCKTLKKETNDFVFMCFSDHGHVKVKNRIDIHSFFRSFGKRLNDYIHLIETNYLRFWFRNKKERDEVSAILSKLDCGFILTNEILKKYNMEMPDNRYGDLIYYLDVPNVFLRSIWHNVTSMQSMHGYLPDYFDSDGVFIANKKIVDVPYVRLVDVMPSIFSLLNVQIPNYVDGRVLWKDK